jgi:hypothetical protein
MDCPICGAQARNVTPGEFDGLVIKCIHCGDYEVPDSAVNGLIRLDYEGRRGALEKAKIVAGAGTRPSITLACL